MRRHEAHSPHGSPSSAGSPRRSQLSAMASTRASVVLPTPRGPQSRYPCATRPRAIAPLSVVDTCDCTATSAKFFGRYFRASASDMAVNLRPVARAGEAGAALIAEPERSRGVAKEKRGDAARFRARLPRNTPGLTKRLQTPHAAATFGVLTELEGCCPPGPGAPINLAAAHRR